MNLPSKMVGRRATDQDSLEAGSAHQPRVALIAPAFPLTQDEPFVPYWADLVSQLAALGADVNVFPLRFPRARHAYELFDASVFPSPHGHLRLRKSPRIWASALKRIGSEHRRAPFDLLHALHGNEAGFVATLAGRMLRRPAAVHFGGGELSAFSDLGYGSDLVPSERWQVRQALRHAALITTGSPSMARGARSRLPAGRRAAVVVAPLGIDVERFGAVPSLRTSPRGQASAERRIDLIAIAELNRIKDYPCLLDAFGRLLQHRPSAVLHIVGGGPMVGALRRHPVAQRHRAGIRWWGQIPPSAIPHALAQAQVFVHASRHEGQCMVLAEAGASGLPIASTHVGVAECFPNWAISLADPADAQGLCDAMLRAIARHERWSGHETGVQDKSQDLRRWTAARFSRRFCAAEWLRHYREQGLFAPNYGPQR